jgi:ribosome biogenesis protein UTP30
MGKKVIKQTKKVAAEEEDAQIADVSTDESEFIKQKKEHDKFMKKHLKEMTARVNETYDLKQAVKAVKALQKFAKAKQAEKKGLLDEEDEFIQLTFTLAQVPSKPTPRPAQIKLAHPFMTADHTSRICVFVKDPQRAFKDEIQDLKIPTIAKVIGYDKLRRNFKQYKDRRSLLKDYDGFLADIRIYKMLPECLGKEFYDKKKFPCPIKLHGFQKPKDLEE